MLGRRIFVCIWSPLELSWWEGVIFAMLITEGPDFYYANVFWSKVWVSLSSMLEPASLASLFCIFSLHILWEQLAQNK